jgi:pimeloyl-ACP methyl ester carboxylesterase
MEQTADGDWIGASMGGAALEPYVLTYPNSSKQLVLLDSAGFAEAPVLAKYMVHSR